MMRLQLRVDVDGMYWSGGAISQIPDLYYQAFEPLKTCDDSIIAYATGENLAGSEEVHRVMKIREDAAEILAGEITRMILAEMKKHDTNNGYPE